MEGVLAITQGRAIMIIELEYFMFNESDGDIFKRYKQSKKVNTDLEINHFVKNALTIRLTQLIKMTREELYEINTERALELIDDAFSLLLVD